MGLFLQGGIEFALLPLVFSRENPYPSYGLNVKTPNPKSIAFLGSFPPSTIPLFLTAEHFAITSMILSAISR